MKNKFLRNSACASTVLFVGFVSLYIYAQIANPHLHLDTPDIFYPHVSLGENVNVTVTKDWSGDLIFFNQNVPYSGSIVSMAGDKTVNVTGCDGWGIYFRSIKHTTRKDWDQWTLMISLWYPIILFGILPTIFVMKKLCSHKSATAKEASAEKRDP